MKDIQLKEFQRAVKFIDALGCTYKIITPEGDEFGTLEVKATKDRKRAPLRYPYGEISKFYRPQLNLQAEIGEVQEIALGKFTAEDYGPYSMMKHKGSSLAPLGTFEQKIPAELVAKVRAKEKAIQDGKFSVKVDDKQPKSTAK